MDAAVVLERGGLYSWPKEMNDWTLSVFCMTVGGGRMVDDSGHEERGKYGDDEFLCAHRPRVL
jgi:hypothetical protein